MFTNAPIGNPTAASSSISPDVEARLKAMDDKHQGMSTPARFPAGSIDGISIPVAPWNSPLLPCSRPVPVQASQPSLPTHAPPLDKQLGTSSRFRCRQSRHPEKMVSRIVVGEYFKQTVADCGFDHATWAAEGRVADNTFAMRFNEPCETAARHVRQILMVQRKCPAEWHRHTWQHRTTRQCPSI